MSNRSLTTRQYLRHLLTQRAFTVRELAGLVQVAERMVEDHLPHIIRSLERNTSEQFMIEKPECVDCHYVFRNRTRLKKPSRCPRCRSEAIIPPRFSITPIRSKGKREN